MREANHKYKKLILVCTNERVGGRECCARKGSFELYEKTKAALKAADPNIRVSKTGCLGNCLSGVSIVLMPDDVWLEDVREEDIQNLVAMAVQQKT